VWIAVAVAVVLIAAAGVRRALSLGAADAVAGVELGMDPDDVQRAFVAPAAGFFSVGSRDGEPELAWRPAVAGPGGPRVVRFAFEDRRLVEVVATFAPDTALADVRAWAGDVPEEAFRDGTLTVR
jgi:hypothetical protein